MRGRELFIKSIVAVCFIQTGICQKYDNTWILGDNYPGSGLGLVKMTFEEDGTYGFEHFQNDGGIDHTNAAICNEDGELLFYTNGEKVYNRWYEEVPGSTGFNDHWFHSAFEGSGLPIFQGAVFINCPEDPMIYYLFHSKIMIGHRDTNSFVLSEGFYHSTLKLIGGNDSAVMIENGIAIDTGMMPAGGLTAIKHANGRDWWIVQPKFFEDSFIRILVDSKGMNKLDDQYITTKHQSSLSSVVASLKGDKLIRCSIHGGADDPDSIYIYDFDRCEGTLSNYRSYEFAPGGTYPAPAAISPSGQFLYIGYGPMLWQYDLDAPDLLASRITVANTLADSVSASFRFAQMGPDSLIYFTEWYSPYMHVIHEPDVEGTACNVELRYIELPVNSGASIPNFPNYRLGPLEGSPCDTISVSIEEPFTGEPIVRIYPNPTTNRINLEVPDVVLWDWRLTCYDALGQLMTVINASGNRYTLDCSNWPAGIYYFEIADKGGHSFTGKLLKVKS